MTVAATLSQEILKPHLSIDGRHPLEGVLRVSGAKNSALVLMTASLLTDETVELTNVPNLTDIEGMSRILESLGVSVARNNDRVALTASGSVPSLPTNLSTASAPVSSALALCWHALGRPRCLYRADAASAHAPSWSTSED